MTSKIATAIFNHVKELQSFTTRDIAGYFPACPFHILKEGVKELLEEKKLFSYGIKRGTFYSVKANLKEDEATDELDPRMIEEVKSFVLSRRDFASSDLFAEMPTHPEHLLRKVLVYLRDEEGIIWLHGHGKGSIWSKHQELPTEETVPEEDEDLKAAILKFAQANLRWFKRSELDDLFGNSAYELRQALFSLMDDGEIQMRGEKRSTEYAYCEVADSEDEDENGEEKADPELSKNILAHIESVGVVTIPQLIEKFSVARTHIVRCLRELEEQEQIYHEGMKKTSRYIHKDHTEVKNEDKPKAAKTNDPETLVAAKAIDRLSSLLLVNSAVYITFINASKKYELRCVNGEHHGATKLFASENADAVINELMKYIKEAS